MTLKVALFDKSFLHGLSQSQADMLDLIFNINIPPVFYAEILADLEKNGKKEEDRLKIVQILSQKTPKAAMPNVVHTTLFLANLLGRKIVMDHRIIKAAGIEAEIDDKIYEYHSLPEEARMLNNWRKGIFSEAEENFAKNYRLKLSKISLGCPIFRFDTNRRFKDLQEIYDFTEVILNRKNACLEMINAALNFLDITLSHRTEIMERWKNAQCPPLKDFAPYSAYIMKVFLFFQIAVNNNLASADKKSNFINLSYLYYLPFTEVFISSDKFHKKNSAILFRKKRQYFIDGEVMKKALSDMVMFYDKHPHKGSKNIFNLLEEIIENTPSIKSIYDRIDPNWRFSMPLPITPLMREELVLLSQEIINASKKIKESDYVDTSSNNQPRIKIIEKMYPNKFFPEENN